MKKSTIDKIISTLFEKEQLKKKATKTDDNWYEVYSHKDLINLFINHGDFKDFKIRLMKDNNDGGWFDRLPITSIKELDTSNITDMSYMFFGCKNLVSVPFMDTSNVTTMEGMFQYCYNLTKVPKMDTSNVTNMNCMFFRCKNLTEVPDMNTYNVTRTESMFCDCKNLTKYPKMDLSNVVKMKGMFDWM